MSDQFDGWRKLLDIAKDSPTKAAFREALGKSGLNITEMEPLSGYYRCAAVKNGPLLPVAIWRDEGGKLIVLRSGEPVALERVWPYSVWTPVSYEDYEAVAERGERWRDEPPTEAADAPENEHAVVGHNQPPEESEVEALRSQIEAAKGVAEQEYKSIEDDDQAAAAQALRSRLNELSGTADKKREAEKRPHLEAGKAVDAKWQPVVKLAKDAADALRRKLSDYATKKARAEDEARRKAQAEADKAAAEARAKAAAEGKPAPEPEKVEEAPAAPVAATIKGASGRAATIRTIKVARVVDYDAAYQHLKAIPEIKQVIDKVAQRMITAGNTVPGVEVEERRDVA